MPLFIVLVAGALIALVIFVSNPTNAAPDIAILLFVLLLLLVEFMLFIIVVLFGIPGAVRFARTGSIREGIRVSAILATIRAMGWFFIFFPLSYSPLSRSSMPSALLSFIPYIGREFVLIAAPFFSIFVARYFTLVYDQGESQR